MVSDNYSLEREGLEKEVLYPPKRRCFDAEKKKIESSEGGWLGDLHRHGEEDMTQATVTLQQPMERDFAW